MRKINMDCTLCDKNHDVEERKRLTTLLIKEDEVEYEVKLTSI